MKEKNVQFFVPCIATKIFFVRYWSFHLKI